MGEVTKFARVAVDELKPYEKNSKIHDEAQIEKLCQSIQEFGFISPILIDEEKNVIAGHGRLMAAKKLGMKTVPAVMANGLTEAQRRAYVITDNRLNEYSEWDMDMVAAEIGDLGRETEIEFLEFSFEERKDKEETEETAGENEETKGTGWHTRDRRCDMKTNIAAREKSGFRYTALYATSKEGPTLEEIKNDKRREKQIAGELAGYIKGAMGGNLAGNGWAMITTGRRRHREGYHFATEVARRAAKEIGIPFHDGAISCENANRLKPRLKMEKKPEEKNLILFDDIITTGTTIEKTRALLEENGYTVIVIIGIRNQ